MPAGHSPYQQRHAQRSVAERLFDMESDKVNTGKAKELRPAIIFIDEADELLKNREFSQYTEARHHSDAWHAVTPRTRISMPPRIFWPRGTRFGRSKVLSLQPVERTLDARPLRSSRAQPR